MQTANLSYFAKKHRTAEQYGVYETKYSVLVAARKVQTFQVSIP